MSLLGERLTSLTRCLATKTTSPMPDGAPIDSGTAMILSHNLAHKQKESCRHLAALLLPGLVGNLGRDFGDYVDVTDPGSYTGVNAISWSPTVSAVAGKCLVLADREQAAEPPHPRQIKVVIDASGGTGSSLVLYAVATTPGAQPTPECLTWGQVTASSGRARNTITLSMSADLVGVYSLSRVTPDSTDVSAVWFDLWVGWYATNASDAVIAANAYEIR